MCVVRPKHVEIGTLYIQYHCRPYHLYLLAPSYRKLNSFLILFCFQNVHEMNPETGLKSERRSKAVATAATDALEENFCKKNVISQFSKTL